LSSHTPTTTSSAIEPAPMPTDTQREVPDTSAAASGERKATTASSGTMSRSSNSRMETIFCPRGVAMSPRSPSSCITMAVEVSTKPMALMKDTVQEKPKATPTSVSMAPQTSTCRLPRPKMARRSAHRCEGCISRPMTKRNITTPSSAVWMMVCGSLNQPKPKGPMARPAAR
jgi:hypothetical protein